MPNKSSAKRSKASIDPQRWRDPSLNAESHFGDYALLVTYLAAFAFVVGVFAPCFTMIPKFGDGAMEDVARTFLADELKPQQFSLVGGMLHLFQSGDILIASLILLFTIIFPLAKLTALFFLVHTDKSTAQKLLGTLADLGKWSMLDVFVIALVVLSFKNFPGGSRVEIHWGLYVFATSVLLSMMTTVLLKQGF